MPGYALFSEPWWVPLAYVLVFGHLTNVCVTLYLHRSATHGGVTFHPVIEHAMRAWLWLTTGMVTKEWVAVHRKHHAFADREGDPHSPTEEGFWAIVLFGVFFYTKASKDREMLEKYGKGTPDDWVERNVYTQYHMLGLLSIMLLDIYLFGAALGLLIWSVMAIWMPIMGNIINGIGHALGYRNFETKDDSHNIYPFGIWIVGEELHNNHHADPRSAKFKAHWWEFDIGWIYIRLLRFLGLAEVTYARDMSAEEFAAQYYAPDPAEEEPEAVAEPEPAPALEPAGQTELVATGFERARTEARARVEQLRAEALHEIDEALAKLGQMRADARQSVQQELAEARAKIEDLKSGARHELEEARAKARSAIERARASMDQPRPGVEGV